MDNQTPHHRRCAPAAPGSLTRGTILSGVLFVLLLALSPPLSAAPPAQWVYTESTGELRIRLEATSLSDFIWYINDTVNTAIMVDAAVAETPLTIVTEGHWGDILKEVMGKYRLKLVEQNDTYTLVGLPAPAPAVTKPAPVAPKPKTPPAQRAQKKAAVATRQAKPQLSESVNNRILDAMIREELRVNKVIFTLWQRHPNLRAGKKEHALFMARRDVYLAKGLLMSEALLKAADDIFRQTVPAQQVQPAQQPAPPPATQVKTPPKVAKVPVVPPKPQQKVKTAPPAPPKATPPPQLAPKAPVMTPPPKPPVAQPPKVGEPETIRPFIPWEAIRDSSVYKRAGPKQRASIRQQWEEDFGDRVGEIPVPTFIEEPQKVSILAMLKKKLGFLFPIISNLFFTLIVAAIGICPALAVRYLLVKDPLTMWNSINIALGVSVAGLIGFSFFGSVLKALAPLIIVGALSVVILQRKNKIYIYINSTIRD